MKLYATTTSERASKGQGGNDFLDISIFILNKENPTHRIKVWQNDMGHIWIKFYKREFDKWIENAEDVIMPNLLKAKRQKGESISGSCTCDEGDCHCQDCDPRY